MSKASVVVALILLWTGGLGQVLGDDDSAFQRVFQTADTVRQSKAQEMRRQMNLNANPCNDFYEYACGNWEAQATRQTKLEQRIDMDLVRLLEETAHRKDSGLARQAKDFYHSCLVALAQPSQKNQHQQQFLSQFIQLNGGFPAVPGSNWRVYHQDYDWLRVAGGLRKNYGMDILIGLRIGYNYANVQENSIYLSEPSTLLPNELCSNHSLHRNDSVYEAIESRVTSQLRIWLAMGNEESARLAADIVSFEHELCGGMSEREPWNSELHLYTANYTRKTLNEFKQLYKIDLEDYVTSCFGQTVYRPVYMAAPEYYRQLQRTLSVRNGSQIANYIMYRAVAALTFPLDDKPASRPNYCLARVKQLLPAALGELYTRQYASEESRQQLAQLYDHLQGALKQSLNAEWLEEGSRRIAQRKLSDLQINFPIYDKQVALRIQLERSNYWQNLRLLLGEVQPQQLKRLFEENLPQPADPLEAYETRLQYRPVQRRLELGWAVLQPPEHDARYGQALMYATLGVGLAEQMASAFDELHWSVGLLERDNWDPLTAYRYRNRSECFEHYVEEYLQSNRSATKLLIRNSAGLNVAFNAYLTWLGFQAPNNDFTRLSKETLPALNYSNTALFFLAYAQQHCHPKEPKPDDLDLWPNLTISVRQSHSWKRLQVNGPLSNSVDFAREFRCPVGSAMNPPKKCMIY